MYIFKLTFVKPFMIVSINEPAGVSHRHEHCSGETVSKQGPDKAF